MSKRDARTLCVLIPALGVLIWRGSALMRTQTPAAAQAAVAVAEIESPATSDARAAVESLIAADGQDRAEAARLGIDPALLAMQAKRGKLAWGRDPFAGRVIQQKAAPPPEPAPPAPHLALTGITGSGDKRYAILGGHVVGKGDKLAGRYLVTDVTENSATIREGKWQFRYTLGADAAETERAEADAAAKPREAAGGVEP